MHVEQDPNSETGTQRFIENLFATGVGGLVDAQYARNYSPNDPRNYNAGRPAGVSTSVVLANSPAFIIGLVAVAAVGLYLIVRR